MNNRVPKALRQRKAKDNPQRSHPDENLIYSGTVRSFRIFLVFFIYFQSLQLIISKLLHYFLVTTKKICLKLLYGSISLSYLTSDVHKRYALIEPECTNNTLTVCDHDNDVK